MIVSSATQLQAEAQKLIKLYNNIPVEFKTANMAELERKVCEAEELVSQIKSLQSAITDIKVPNNCQTQATQNQSEDSSHNQIRHLKTDQYVKRTTNKTDTPVTLKINNNADCAEVERIVLEDRIERIEAAQKQTRAQIEQLNQVKTKLINLQQQTEKNTETMRTLNRHHHMSQELAKLLTVQLKVQETKHKSLKTELETIRKQARQDTNLLKEQRDAAVAKQKQLEKEKQLILRHRKTHQSFLMGLLIGIGISTLVVVFLFWVR